MNRPVATPTDELFRPTGHPEARGVGPTELAESAETTESAEPAEPADFPAPGAGQAGRPTPGEPTAGEPTPGESAPTGRERHDAKITVYVSAEELLDLERAKLTLRGDHRVAVDRGRIVREAIAVVLADLHEQGADSVLVRRLRGI